MELINDINDDLLNFNFFLLKKNMKKCNCGNEYFLTFLFEQKYCKNCLKRIINTMGNNIYLDVYISTNNIQCDKHEARNTTNFSTRNIQEWCGCCSEILYFKQIVSQSSSDNLSHFFNFKMNFEQYKIIEREKCCEKCDKCGKSIYQVIGLTNSLGFRLCSCYQISSE